MPKKIKLPPSEEWIKLPMASKYWLRFKTNRRMVVYSMERPDKEIELIIEEK